MIYHICKNLKKILPTNWGEQWFSTIDTAKTGDIGIVYPFNNEADINGDIVCSSIIDHSDGVRIKQTEVREAFSKKTDKKIHYNKIATISITFKERTTECPSIARSLLEDEKIAYANTANLDNINIGALKEISEAIHAPVLVMASHVKEKSNFAKFWKYTTDPLKQISKLSKPHQPSLFDDSDICEDFGLSLLGDTIAKDAPLTSSDREILQQKGNIKKSLLSEGLYKYICTTSKELDLHYNTIIKMLRKYATN